MKISLILLIYEYILNFDLASSGILEFPCTQPAWPGQRNRIDVYPRLQFKSIRRLLRFCLRKMIRNKPWIYTRQ
jgi:hypothetical protein